MNKYLISLFLACFLSSVAAEESSDKAIRSAVQELDTILRSGRSTQEKSQARTQFFKKIEGLDENASLDPLIREESYFNTAFSQILEQIESRLSDRLFKEALDMEDFFALRPMSGSPATLLAHEYLRNRFDLKLNEETRSGLYGAFVDSEFLGGLSQEFDAIIAAGSEGEKSEAEGKAARFLENYAYRPIFEVLEEKTEKQIRQKERIKPEDKNEFSTIEPRAKKPAHLSKPDVVNKDGDYRDFPQFPGLLWGMFSVIVVVAFLFILRNKLKS